MIPTTITLTLDDKAIETINRLISALEKINPKSVAPAQPTVQAAPSTAESSTPLNAAPTQPVASTVVPVPTAQAPVQPPVTQTPAAQPVAEVQQQAAIPTSHVAQPYTIEQLQTAMASLVDAGKMEDIRALLSGFGVPSIMGLQPDQYGALATALRGMGAQI